MKKWILISLAIVQITGFLYYLALYLYLLNIEMIKRVYVPWKYICKISNVCR